MAAGGNTAAPKDLVKIPEVPNKGSMAVSHAPSGKSAKGRETGDRDK